MAVGRDCLNMSLSHGAAMPSMTPRPVHPSLRAQFEAGVILYFRANKAVVTAERAARQAILDLAALQSQRALLAARLSLIRYQAAREERAEAQALCVAARGLPLYSTPADRFQ